MRLIPPFSYYRAKTLDDALTLLKTLEGKTSVIAGGTDYLAKVKKGQTKPENLVDLSFLKELNYIKLNSVTVKIGSLTRHKDIADSDVIKNSVPILTDAESNIGSVEIRNKGTLAGNLCNASPAADTAPPLLVLDSKLKIQSKDAERIVPINEFFLGPGKTVLKPDELLTEIQVPAFSDVGSCFLKLGRRTAFTLSVVSIAALVSERANCFKDVKIALGSVAPTPIRAYKAESFLIGKEISQKRIDDAAGIVSEEVKPISDARGTAEYRREMSKVLARRALLEALGKLKARRA